MIRRGFPAYVTSVGWLGYSDEKVKEVSVCVFVLHFDLSQKAVKRCIVLFLSVLMLLAG